MKEEKRDLCGTCCDFYYQYHGSDLTSTTEDGKQLYLIFEEDYKKLMLRVLEEEFSVVSAPAVDIIETLGSGNWDHLWETKKEEKESLSFILDDMLGDIFYCSDRWSWDRFLRINWAHQRLMRRFEALKEKV